MTDPLRIVYRGNFTKPWCTEVHVAASLEALGHRVVRLQENAVSWQDCVDAAKRAHLFLWTKTWTADEEGGRAALAELASLGVPTVSFHLDRYIGLDREEQITHDPFWRTAHVFTADGGNDEAFAVYGVNHHWMPPGMYDAEAHIGKPNGKFHHPVVFVGSYPYPHAEWADYRRELIETVRAHFGAMFAVWPQGRPIRNRELSDLYASASVVIGDSCLSRGATRYWSDRVPETLGRGALLIHPAVEGMEDWYRNHHDLLTYELGDFDAVVELCKWALANPSDAQILAKQGQATVLGRDTYKHRLAEVIETVRAAEGLHEPERVVGRVTARHRQAQRPTSFHVRDGHPTDREVIEEVWKADQYGIERAHVRGKVVVDVGANIGAFSVLAATLGASEIHAYEPEPGNTEMLRLNTAGMPVVVHEEALGADSGSAFLERGPHDTHGGGTHLRPADGAENPTERVPQIGVNEALAMIGPVGLLKIDCEGSEYPIIEALDPEIIVQVERMVGEFHGPHMPHLRHLWISDETPHYDEDEFLKEWGAFAAKLADFGHVEFHGHPRAGGVFRWIRY